MWDCKCSSARKLADDPRVFFFFWHVFVCGSLSNLRKGCYAVREATIVE